MAQNYSSKDVKPSDSFQKLCQVMINEGLDRQRIEDFRVILHMIMLECSRANIETGKTWVFEHCHSAVQTFALMEYLYSLSKSRSGSQERLYLIYLVNDLLFHAARKQMTWMRDAMLPLLVPLLKLAHEAAETDEYRSKVTKCITFWSDRDIFDQETLVQMRQSVIGPTLFPPLSIPLVPYTPPQSFVPPIKVQMITPPKPYHELPAGIMTLMQHNNYYQPMDPTAIKVPFPRPPPSQELLAAVDTFYSGLNTIALEDPVFDDKAPIDPQGWEKGYLDKFYERLALRKSTQRSPENSSHQNYNSGRSSSRSRSYSRSRSRSYSKSYSRSPSPSYRRNRDRSVSRGRSPYRSQSPSRRRSPSPRRRSPSPRRRSPSPRRRSPSPRRRSPSPRRRSPSPRRRSPSPYYGRTAPSQDSRRLGLGNQSADEFTAFRKNKSQSYSRREPPPPLICYKCGKPGHLARECDSL